MIFNQDKFPFQNHIKESKPTLSFEGYCHLSMSTLQGYECQTKIFLTKAVLWLFCLCLLVRRQCKICQPHIVKIQITFIKLKETQTFL